MKTNYGTCWAILIGAAFFTPVSAASDYGSVKEGISQVCDTTVPAYAESFQNGGKAFILSELQKSKAYKALDPFQQSAFARLLGQTTNLPPEQASKRCHDLLDEFDTEAHALSFQYCKSWAEGVYNIARLQAAGALSDSVRLSMSGGNKDMGELIDSVADQAKNLAEGATAETLSKAHYYTCFKSLLIDEGNKDE